MSNKSPYYVDLELIWPLFFGLSTLQNYINCSLFNKTLPNILNPPSFFHRSKKSPTQGTAAFIRKVAERKITASRLGLVWPPSSSTPQTPKTRRSRAKEGVFGVVECLCLGSGNFLGVGCFFFFFWGGGGVFFLVFGCLLLLLWLCFLILVYFLVWFGSWLRVGTDGWVRDLVALGLYIHTCVLHIIDNIM